MAVAVAVASTRIGVGAAPVVATTPPVTRIGTTPLSLTVPPPKQQFTSDPALAEIGRRIFFDRTLSEPRGISCASCHVPKQGYGGGRSTRFGVPAGSRPGYLAARAAPSLLYVRYTPPLYLYQDDDANAPEPRGGLFADGRHDGIAAAIAAPLLNADEMNNRDVGTLAAKLAKAPYAGTLAQRFGPNLDTDPTRALAAAGAALQAYLETDAMAPFSSRYDRQARGEAVLTPVEAKGMRLFVDPDKGNCASCHAFTPTSSNGARSLFTDFGYDAIAAPRNRALPVNRDARRFDLGLCDTARAKGWPEPEQWCGYFKTPTLRNVALRERYMHNGSLKSLREVVEFYATRSTDPTRWYGRAGRFDDVTEAAIANVNVNSAPLNRRAGTTPALNDEEIDALVAFMRTLTDQRYEALAASRLQRPVSLR